MGLFDRLFGREPREKDDEAGGGAPPARVESSLAPQHDPAGGLEVKFELVRGEEREPVRRPFGEDLDASIPPQVWKHELAVGQLLDEERAREQQDRYLIPYTQLGEVEDDLLELLEVRRTPGWKLNLDVSGVIGKGGLTIEPRWTSPEGVYDVLSQGGYLELPCGFLHEDRGELHVLPKALLEALGHVRRLTGDGTELTEEFELLARIQECIERYRQGQAIEHVNPHVDVEMDGQLEQEQFLAPRKFDVDMRPDEEGGLELRPLIEGYADTFEEAEALANSSADRSRLFRQDPSSGKKIRLALPERTRREINRLRKRRHIPREDVAEFVRDPRRYLQPPEELEAEGLLSDEEEEEILDLGRLPDRVVEYDLEEYGARVMGIGAHEGADERPRSVSGLGEGWFGDDIEPDEEQREDTIPAAEESEQENQSGQEEEVLLTADNREEMSYEEQRAQTLRKRFDELEVADSFDATLYPYQEEGYAWLRSMYDGDDSTGGLLADDMGLGKTVQVIALICFMHEQEDLAPSLFVVPKSVMENWRQELDKFCSARLALVEYHGSDRPKNLAMLERADILLTTYGTMLRDQILLGKLDLHALVLDEAQAIKNSTTKRASAARAMNARLRIALTATPVENSLDELWSIMDFAAPGRLGTLARFREDFATPLEAAAREGTARMDEVALQLLGQIEDHYLRRTKAGVLAEELPSKHLHRLELEMTPAQVEMYDRVRRWGRKTYKQNLLGVIHPMIRVCTHPYAIGADKLEAVGAEVTSQQVHDDPALLIDASNKFSWMVTKLEEVRARGEKAILFSSLRSIQSMLQQIMRLKFGLSSSLINGDTSARRRQAIIDDFNRGEGFDVIILSTLAAGVGLNVTGANHVFHMTREWNPAKENQATDRAYRIGQERDVHVYIPITKHPRAPTLESIDQRIDQLLQDKEALAQNVIRPSMDIKIGAADLELCVFQEESL